MENGAGIRSLRITLTEADGTVRTVLSGAFGTYRFTEVNAGQSVVLSISAKKFSFSQPTLVLTLTEDANGIEFIALDQ